MIKFMVFGDLHYDDSQDGDRRVEELLSRAQTEEVDFIVSLGDLCHPLEKNRSVLERINSAGIPLYHSIGNHDTQVCGLGETLAFLALPRAYYSFTYGDYKFIILNSCYYRQEGVDYPLEYNRKKPGCILPVIPGEELEWLEGELQENRNYIIFSHHSLVNEFANRGVQNRDKVLELFAGRKVLLCMNGHDHGDDCKMVEGIPFYTVNSAFGAWLGTQIGSAEHLKEKYGYLHGYVPYKQALHVIVELDGEEIRIRGVAGEYQSVTPDDIELYDHRWNGVAVEPRTSPRSIRHS